VGTRPARRSTETELDLVVVAGSETGRRGSLLVLKKSVATVEYK
jgi:ribosomal protein L3